MIMEHNTKTISAKAFIISPQPCEKLPKEIEQMMKVMANNLIQKFLAQQEAKQK